MIRPRPARRHEVATLDLMRLFAAQAVMFYHFVFLSWAEDPESHGIRAVAGTPVVFADAVGWSSLGWIGVQLFFVISGFVILLSAENRPAFDFVLGRISRIVPGLWCLSLLSALVLLAADVLPPQELAPRLLRSLVLFPVGPWVDGAVWTLVAEAVFYTAVFIMIITGALARIGAVLVAVTLAGLLFWTAVVVGDRGLLGPAGEQLAQLASSYRLRVTLVTTNCYFALGASLYQLFRGRYPRLNGTLLACNFTMGLIATYYAALSSLGVSRFQQSPFAAPAAWGVMTLLMILGVLLRLGKGADFRHFAATAGLLTYPLYLINQITGGLLLGTAYRLGLPPALAVIATAALCTMLAAAFALLAERPLQRRLKAVIADKRNYIQLFKDA